ncbi:Spherulation-specific family 4 [Neurospora crassa]|nr:Spherulation-specific family 4 [Neurospora crassa]
MAAIRLDGIFVDEVPIDAQYLDYLQRITDSVRSGFAEAAYRRSHCDSINSSEDTSLSAPSSSTTSSTTGLGIVIHNPGIFPSADSSDAFFSSRLVDYVVVFENCLAAWWDSGDYVNANLALLTPEKRAKAIAVAHTCGCGPKSQAGGGSGGRPQQPDSEGHHAAEAKKTEGSEKEAIKKNVQNFLDEVVTQHKLAGHFATSATDYATWCSGWEGYVEVACDLGGNNMLTGEASEEGLHG